MTTYPPTEAFYAGQEAFKQGLPEAACPFTDEVHDTYSLRAEWIRAWRITRKYARYYATIAAKRAARQEQPR